MSQHGFWFNELKKNVEKGPDWVLQIYFLDSINNPIQNELEKIDLKPYRKWTKNPQSPLQFICECHYDNLISKSNLRAPFNLIEALPQSLQIFRFSNGHGLKDYAEKEMNLIELSLKIPELDWKEWNIRQGGDGVYTTIKKGGEKKDFEVYLKTLSTY